MNGQFRFGDITPIKYFAGIGIVLACLFTFVGEDGNLWKRFFQWLLQVLVPLILILAAHFLLEKAIGFKRLNPWCKLLLSGILGAILFTPLAFQLDIFLGNDTLVDRNYGLALLEEFRALVLPVTLAWVAMNVPWLLGYQIIREQAPAAVNINSIIDTPEVKVDKEIAIKETPVFVQLLPDDIKADVVFLKSELHYLSVHTEKGKALILYALKDAILELGNDLGFQPHRSYWVATKAINTLEKNGREGVLHLKSGTKIPVSRNKFSEVKRQISD